MKLLVKHMTIGGRHSVQVRAPDLYDDCLAYAAAHPVGGVRYFVRFVLEGPTAGRMFNPHQEPPRRRADWTAAGLTGFRAVTEVAFRHYLAFLRTGVEGSLLLAEREVN